MPYSSITRDSRHPFETYTLAACVIAGGSAVFGGLRPSAINAAFPLWAQIIWGALLGGGALIALVGIWYKRRPVGIFLEQVRLVSTGFMCFTHAASVYAFNNKGGFTSFCLFTLVGAACIKQYLRLRTFLKHVDKIATMREEGK